MNKSPKAAMIMRLQSLASEYDTWWTTPRGEAAQVCSGGLYIPAIKKSVAWGDIPAPCLASMLKDNERDLRKSPLLTRKQAGLVVKKTKYVPIHLNEKLSRAKLEAPKKPVVWEEVAPQALPEPALPPGFDEEPPF